MFYNAKKISEISEVERMSAIISGRIMADAEYKSTYISFLSLGYSCLKQSNRSKKQMQSV